MNDFDVIRLDSCSSTNDVALERALGGARPGTVIVAAEQTRGRGQKGRSWHAPPGENLTFSLVLRPARAMRDVAPLTLAAGLGVHQAVAGFGIDASLKWPNDVLVGQKKLAGLLCEMRTQGERVLAAVLGIGLNVNTVAFPDALCDRATSLRQQTAHPDHVDEVLERLLPCLEMWLDRFDTGGVAEVAPAWWERAYRGPLALEYLGEPVAGKALGLCDDGALRVQTASGRELVVHSGDISAG